MDSKTKVLLFLGFSIILGSGFISLSILSLIQKNFVDSAYIGNAIVSITQALETDRILSSQTNALSLDEAATYLRIRKEELLRITKFGYQAPKEQIPFYKVGGDIYFSKEKLDDWINKSSEEHISY